MLQKSYLDYIKEDSDSEFSNFQIKFLNIKPDLERIIPKRKMQAFTKLLALNDELHLNSKGQKWTREELYER